MLCFCVVLLQLGLSQGLQGPDEVLHSVHTRRLRARIDSPHRWPDFLIPPRERKNGQAFQGDHGRLRAALSRYAATGNLSVAVVGGSISAGAGAFDSHCWVEWLEDWLGQQYNGSRDYLSPGQPGYGSPNVRVWDGAVPGTFSSYMSVCHSIHVPQDADVIIVEYALNDEHTHSKSLWDNAVRRAFERLLRKLLSYPKHPAVVLLNAYSWFQLDPSKVSGTYYTGSDAQFFELASYYQLPMLSVKTCCWRLMLNGVPGFMVNRTRSHLVTQLLEQDTQVDQVLRDNMFYWDAVHPNGQTGHRAMSDLVVQLFIDVERGLKKRAWTELEAGRVASRTVLPPPMIPGNWESSSDRCFIGPSLLDLVIPAADPADPAFTWLNDQPEGKRPKWGLIATQAGATLRFKIDTRTASSSQAAVRAAATAGQATVGGGDDTRHVDRAPLVSVLVAHLKSYQGMGLANVRCASGCCCVPAVLDGLHTPLVSLVALLELQVTQHHECVIEVQARGAGSSSRNATHTPGSEGTKVKITGLMVSDEGSGARAVDGMNLKDFVALDFVTTGLKPEQPSSTFEIRQTWD